jgi:hypothetical protein
MANPCQGRGRRHGYNPRMGSVAADLRVSLRRRIEAMSPNERLALTGRLAEADVDLLCSSRNITREAATRVFMRQRQAGRRFSGAMGERAT